MKRLGNEKKFQVSVDEIEVRSRWGDSKCLHKLICNVNILYTAYSDSRFPYISQTFMDSIYNVRLNSVIVYISWSKRSRKNCWESWSNTTNRKCYCVSENFICLVTPTSGQYIVVGYVTAWSFLLAISMKRDQENTTLWALRLASPEDSGNIHRNILVLWLSRCQTLRLHVIVSMAM